jgi:uncharacterized membrane protein
MTVERLVARVLMVGGAVSVAIMVLGLVVLESHALATGTRLEVPRADGRAADVFVSIPQIARALAQWPPDPLAGIALGLAVLLLTPICGVVAALICFTRIADRDYLVICIVLLVELCCGVLFRIGH